jgi:hypothetical protein
VKIWPAIITQIGLHGVTVRPAAAALQRNAKRPAGKPAGRLRHSIDEI